MSRPRARVPAHRRSFPRVSGDEPIFWVDVVNANVFSPRERG